MARRKYQIDVRTQTMSAEALTCRTFGHAIAPVDTPAALRARHRRHGERLIMLRCSRGCSYWRDLIVDLYNGEEIRVRSGYTDPASYLVQEHGTGRLRRAAARAAFFAPHD